MVKYHISKKTQKPAQCRAQERPCPLGENARHFTTQAEAVKFIEAKNEETLELFPSSEPPMEADKVSLSKHEETVLKRQLRMDLYAQDYKQLLAKGLTANLSAYVDLYGMNREAALSYEHPDTIHAFTKGACAGLAAAIHEKSGYPLVLFTDESAVGANTWMGHAVVKVGENEYLDVEGTKTKEQIFRQFNMREGSTVEELSYPDFKNRIALPEEGPYAKLDPYPKAVLERVSNDLIQDFKAGII